MKPTIGRIVHFVNGHNSMTHHAAMVLYVWPNDYVNLWVFPSTSEGEEVGFRTSVPLCQSFRHTWANRDQVDAFKNTWHWPERV